MRETAGKRNFPAVALWLAKTIFLDFVTPVWYNKTMRENIKKRVMDLVRRSENKHIVTHTGFLPVEDAAEMQGMLAGLSAPHLFCGGYPNAERTVFFALPEGFNRMNFDAAQYFTAVKMDVGDRKTYSHRDYLGSVMALGLDRDKLGDIVTEGGSGYLVGFPAACSYVCDNLERVSRTSVKCTLCALTAIPRRITDTQQFTGSLTSLRADCVVSAVFGLSRSHAAEMIEAGFFTLNSVQVTKPDKLLKIGDLAALRRYGRVRLSEETGISRKGKLRVRFEKEI